MRCKVSTGRRDSLGTLYKTAHPKSRKLPTAIELAAKLNSTMKIDITLDDVQKPEDHWMEGHWWPVEAESVPQLIGQLLQRIEALEAAVNYTREAEGC